MDWAKWHKLYDARMSLAARLKLVRQQIRAALDEAPISPIKIISICSGDGRDIIGALAGYSRNREVTAFLYDLDEESLERGRHAASSAGLMSQIHFRRADATQRATYRESAPADIIVISGVLGHVSDASLSDLLEALPALCRPGASVIWNRHLVLHDGATRVATIRGMFQNAGFFERSYEVTSKRGFAVARSSFTGITRPLEGDRPLFDFVGLDRLLLDSRDPLPLVRFPAAEETPLERGAQGDMSLPAVFEEVARRHPQRIALGAGEWSATYAELSHAANRLARALAGRGVVKGERVAILMKHDSPLLVAVLATLKAGGVVVVLNSTEPPERHAQVWADAEPVLIISDQKLRDAAEALAGGQGRAIPVEGYLHGRSEPDPVTKCSPGDLAFLIYTSGTTGKPKGVMQTHRNIVHNVHRTSLGMKPSEADRIILLASMSGGLGLSVAWSALLNGAALHLFPAMELGVTGLAEWLRRQQITVFISSASVFRTLVGSLGPGVSFPQVRLVRIGSEQANSQDFRLFRETFADDTIFLHTLSCSETGNITQLTLRKEDQVAEGILPVGNCAHGMEISIRYSTGEEVACGVTGEIVVRSEFLSPGYWRDPELTTQRFLTPTLSTGVREFHGGDLGSFDSSSQLFFKGRGDNQVKIHGYRVELGEVEAALMLQPTVKSAAVRAWGSDAGEMKLAAYVVPVSVDKNLKSALRAALRVKLPGPMIPADFVFLAQLPLTPHGKVDRGALPPISTADHNTRKSVASEEKAVSTPTELFLTELWSEVFDHKGIGPQDDFFDLGGDSLTAMVISARVEADLGVRLELDTFPKHPSLTELAAEIERLLSSGCVEAVSRIERVSRDGPIPLSHQQERIWRFSQTPEESAGYVIAISYHLRGPLNVRAFHASLAYLHRRHEILRTTFRDNHGVITQVAASDGLVHFTQVDISGVADPVSEVQRLANEYSFPFDLKTGPLFRFYLFCISEEEHWFLRVNHHINSDGPSWTIFMRELKVIYESLCLGEAPPLPDSMPLQYADYAAFQRKQFQRGSPAWNEMLAWWKEHLANPPPPPVFSFAREVPDPDAPAQDGYLPLPTTVELTHEAMQSAIQRWRTTSYVVRLAAFTALHALESRQADFALGVYITTRDSVETLGMFGDFANLATLRFCCDPSLSFEQWVLAVRETVGNAQSRSGISYEDLCEELRAQGQEPPEIRLIMSERRSIEATMLGEVSLTHYVTPSAGQASTHIPWGFTLTSNGEETNLSAAYDPRVYDPRKVQAMITRLHTLIDEALRDPQRPIAELLPPGAVK